MAFSVAGLASDGETQIVDSQCVDVSYPEFYATLNSVSILLIHHRDLSVHEKDLVLCLWLRFRDVRKSKGVQISVSFSKHPSIYTTNTTPSLSHVMISQ